MNLTKNNFKALDINNPLINSNNFIVTLETLQLEIYVRITDKTNYNTGTRIEKEIDYDLNLNYLVWIGLLSSLSSLVVLADNKVKYWENKSIRDMVYQIIDSSPGIHFREICRELNKMNGVISYHLNKLENFENTVFSYQDGRYTRYFTKNLPLMESNNEKLIHLVSILRNPTMNLIIKILDETNNGKSRKQLANMLGITVQGVSYNCKKLLTLNLIETYIQDKQKFYVLSKETKEIINLFPFFENFFNVYNGK